MQDLIDRNELIEKLKQTKFPCVLPSGIDYLEGIQTAVTRITGIINDAVQVEAEPVRHGRWVQKILPIGGGDKIRMYLCSECEKYVSMDSDYCPNCGAKMDKGAEENEAD